MTVAIRRSDIFSSLSRFETLAFVLQRGTHTSSDGRKATPAQDLSSEASLRQGPLSTSNWKFVDSRNLGIHGSALPKSSWKVLEILQRKGFKAYLVGGCVRDLILRRKPKDFDVVTTASLKQIKEQFQRCTVIGRKFPICQVRIFGSMVEVSSFDTVPMGAKRRSKSQLTQMQTRCDERDFVRWKDSTRRDFTINGLFFDPFVHTIYDYVDGIKDIKASKLRTIIPACASFKEDCARILRALRIVARLGLQISRDTAAALQDLSSSVTTLSKDRLMMELNYMMAYGAAEPSIHLLHRYKLLDWLLPFQAAYLLDHYKNQRVGSSMLTKLLSNLDKLLDAGRPCNCSLWLGLLVFHMALVNHPQNALVIWTFSSILYMGSCRQALTFIREHNIGEIHFVPEILIPLGTESDEVILEKTSQFVSLVGTYTKTLTSSDALAESLARYSVASPGFNVNVSKKLEKDVAQLFHVLKKDITKYACKRESDHINYELLKKGDLSESRFVLGKVIFDTMKSELIRQRKESHMNIEPINPHNQVLTKESEATRQEEKLQEDIVHVDEKLFEDILSTQKQENSLKDITCQDEQLPKDIVPVLELEESLEDVTHQDEKLFEDILPIQKQEKLLEDITHKHKSLLKGILPIQKQEKSLQDIELIHQHTQKQLVDPPKNAKPTAAGKRYHPSSLKKIKLQRSLSDLFK